MVYQLLKVSRLNNAISIPRRYSVSKYIKELYRRNLVANCYPSKILEEHEEKIIKLPACVYAGFDPTADSLHLGNLLVLLNLLRASQFGVKPIAIVGGATALIGDPSGRDTERDEAKIEEVFEQSKSIEQQLYKISCNAPTVNAIPLRVMNNYEWFKDFSMIDYLRSCKSHRLGEMLRMGAIKNRMTDNSGISFTEFSYQTMQAYDWYHLSKKEDCLFQIGGSDQLGHLDLGAHYINRNSNRFAAGICLPLLIDSSGKKLGKSAGAPIWLSPSRTSPFHFFQYFKQLHDTDAEKLFLQFSLLPYEEMITIVEKHNENLGKWIVQEALAKEMTVVVHGKEGLERALSCTRALFEGDIGEILMLEHNELLNIFGNTTKISVSLKNMGQLACATRSDKQKGDILMTRGAFKVNGKKFIEPDHIIDFRSLILPKTNNLSLVCWGKRKFQLVEWI
ncbi:unnamed protein product [Auanema sp. JU1783]|nr:unnamed protein product [Auanema sp. JU1783]